ncbi:MAG TPA: hypothetical protein VGK33_06025, partial [Chloroflexota bacterium]
ARDGRLAEAIGARRADELLTQMPALRNPISALRLKSAWESALELIQLLGADARFEVAGAT